METKTSNDYGHKQHLLDQQIPTQFYFTFCKIYYLECTYIKHITSCTLSLK